MGPGLGPCALRSGPHRAGEAAPAAARGTAHRARAGLPAAARCSVHVDPRALQGVVPGDQGGRRVVRLAGTQGRPGRAPAVHARPGGAAA